MCYEYLRQWMAKVRVLRWFYISSWLETTAKWPGHQQGNDNSLVRTQGWTRASGSWRSPRNTFLTMKASWGRVHHGCGQSCQPLPYTLTLVPPRSVHLPAPEHHTNQTVCALLYLEFLVKRYLWDSTIYSECYFFVHIHDVTFIAE